MHSYVHKTTLKNIVALAALIAIGHFSSDAAWAQDGKMLDKCVGNNDRESAAASISACTTLIRSYNFPIYYQQRGNAYMRRGDYDHAIADYSEGIRLHAKKGGQEDFFYSRAQAYVAKKDYNHAIADYSEAIRACGDCYGAKYYYSDRAYIFSITKDLDHAIADYSEAIRHSRQDPEYYEKRADVYMQKNDNNRAIVDLTEAIRLNPVYHAVYLSRGKALEKLGELRKALVDFRTAFNLEKNDSFGSEGRAKSTENITRVEQKLAASSTQNPVAPTQVQGNPPTKQVANSKSLDCNDLTTIKTPEDFYFCANKSDAKGGRSESPAGPSPAPNQNRPR